MLSMKRSIFKMKHSIFKSRDGTQATPKLPAAFTQTKALNTPREQKEKHFHRIPSFI